jgi:hypothetical protein
MYHLRHILEPLGIDSHIPTASQEVSAADDVWTGIFPHEREGYRLRDEEDGVERCPECFGEVMDGGCQMCGAEFSEDENEMVEDVWGVNELLDVEGSDEEGEGLLLVESDDGGDGVELILEDRSIDSEDEDRVERGGRIRRRAGARGLGGRRNVPIRIEDVLDLAAEESDEDGMGNYHSGSDVPLGEGGRYQQGYDDDDTEMDDDEEDSYEGSFIDDAAEEDESANEKQGSAGEVDELENDDDESVEDVVEAPRGRDRRRRAPAGFSA